MRDKQSILILIIVILSIFLWVGGSIALKYVKEKTITDYTAKLIEDGRFHYQEGYYIVDLKLKKMYIDVNSPYYKEVEELNKTLK
jgi:hypothetical protein